MSNTPFHDRLVKIAIHRRERIGGREKDTFVERFKRYFHPSLYEDLMRDYPPVEGFIITIFPTPAQDALHWPS